jgi:hypothetical protein
LVARQARTDMLLRVTLCFVLQRARTTPTAYLAVPLPARLAHPPRSITRTRARASAPAAMHPPQSTSNGQQATWCVRSALQANLLFGGRVSASCVRATTSTAQRALGAAQLVSGPNMFIDRCKHLICFVCRSGQPPNKIWSPDLMLCFHKSLRELWLALG